MSSTAPTDGFGYLIKKDDDFLAFERVLVEAHQRTPIRMLRKPVAPAEETR